MASKYVTVFCLLLLVTPGAWGQVCPELLVEWEVSRTYHSPQGIAMDGNYVYLVDWTGLFVVDVSVPADPKQVGSCATPGGAASVALAGGYAFVADWDGGLRVIDISNPANPQEAGFLEFESARQVVISERLAYVANSRYGNYGLTIIDVSEPKRPVQIAHFDTPDSGTSVAVSGDLAILGVWEGYTGGGVYLIDVSDPEHPVQLGYHHGRGAVSGVELSGALAFVTTGLHIGPVPWFTFAVLDIADPAVPAELSARRLTIGSEAPLHVEEDMVYLGPGYYAMDVSNPTYPVLVNGLFIYPYVMDIVVSGNLAYYANWDLRLDVYDISSCDDILVFAEGFDSGETTWWSSTAGDSRKTR